MIDMDAVNREIQSAHAELDAPDNEKGILSLATRTRIWRAMLDLDDPERSYRHRTHLHMACVRRVQHYWDQAFPRDSRVEEMLTLTQQLIDQQVDPDQAKERSDRFHVDAFDETDDSRDDNRRALLVADAASRTVISACRRNPDYDTAGDDEDDDELLPDALEPSYACAGAACGALNWQPVEETDVPARRAFWTWYLDEAIPQALAS